MCEKSKCRHRTEGLCSCPPVKNREDNLLALLEHMAVNMTDVHWELDYTDLNRPEKRRLCRVGTCRVCGGVLCHEMDASDHLAGDGFLAAVYRHLYQVHHAGGRDMTDAEFRRRFVELFHVQDRPVVRAWLERPENSDVRYMYRRGSGAADAGEPILEIPVYTIVRTGTDSDRGLFPGPQTEGSFLSLRRARAELKKMIEAEKDELDDRYDSMECGEDHWEAFQDGYAAALFTRLEIVSSNLHLPSCVEMPEARSRRQNTPCCGASGAPRCEDIRDTRAPLDAAYKEYRRMIAEELGAMDCILKTRMNCCMFTNTRSDVLGCLNAIRGDKRLSGFEVWAGIRLFKEFLDFCRDYDIVSGYDGKAVDALFNGLKEKEEDEDA